MIMYVEVSDPDHNIPSGAATTKVADHEDESKPTKETITTMEKDHQIQ